MAGLGSVENNKGTYLSIAGGYIWNRKADVSDPDYATQKYTKADKTEGERAGAQYGDFSGLITGIEFKTHPEYGESLNVTMSAGEEIYVVSISTNNRYSQDFMKALLKVDLEKELYMKPYDFVDKTGRRANGIVFRQNGEKISLRNDDAPSHESEWFKTNDRKTVKRFFEDLTDWFVAEVEEKVISQMSEAPVVEKKAGLGKVAKAESEPEANDEPEDKPKAKVVKKEEEAPSVTPFKMKKALKAYIQSEYGDEETLPNTLTGDEIVVWYKLSLEGEELPFDSFREVDVKVASSDLDDQLNNLLNR